MARKDNPLYARWKSMKQRCYNPNHIYYRNYGARGITMCDQWRNDFMQFYEWAIESGYKKGLTIDRINNDKGYYPENCRWATKKEQGRNLRTNLKVTIGGETKLLCEWAEISGISMKNISKRIKRGWKDIELIKPLNTKILNNKGERITTSTSNMNKN